MADFPFTYRIERKDGSVATTDRPDLSPAQKELLLSIAQEGDIDMYGAGKRLGRSTSTIQGAIKRLFQESLIKVSRTEKSRRGATDKMIYTLTPRGFFVTVRLLGDSLPALWSDPDPDIGAYFDAHHAFHKEIFQIYHLHTDFDSEILEILPDLTDDLIAISENHALEISRALIACSQMGIFHSASGWYKLDIPSEGDFRPFDNEFTDRLLRGTLDYDDEQVAALMKYPSVWVKIRAGLEEKMITMQNRIDWIREVLEREG